jgi:hypothetical protein
MCAAVASIPETVILPLTDLSGETVMVPFADAAVLSGGTSWSPDRLTFNPSALAAIVIVHPNPIKKVTADAIDRALIA